MWCVAVDLTFIFSRPNIVPRLILVRSFLGDRNLRGLCLCCCVHCLPHALLVQLRAAVRLRIRGRDGLFDGDGLVLGQVLGRLASRDALY